MQYKNQNNQSYVVLAEQLVFFYFKYNKKVTL